jgi:hypothetical protein
MALLFFEGFDSYGDVTQLGQQLSLITTGGSAAAIKTAAPRTGRACLNLLFVVNNQCGTLRATLQRWPGANGRTFGSAEAGVAVVPGAMAGVVGAWPVDSADGLRPPSLPTGPSTAEGSSICFIVDFILPVSPRANACPEKPGAAHSGLRMRSPRDFIALSASQAACPA